MAATHPELSTEALAALRQQLDAERVTVLADLDGMPLDRGDTVLEDIVADDALRSGAERHLGEIDAALARLEDGSYGMCTRCHEPIAVARLEALPSNPLCLNCAAASRGVL